MKRFIIAFLLFFIMPIGAWASCYPNCQSLYDDYMKYLNGLVEISDKTQSVDLQTTESELNARQKAWQDCDKEEKAKEYARLAALEKERQDCVADTSKQWIDDKCINKSVSSRGATAGAMTPVVVATAQDDKEKDLCTKSGGDWTLNGCNCDPKNDGIKYYDEDAKDCKNLIDESQKPDELQCPAENPRMKSLNESNKVGDSCSYGNVTVGKIFKYAPGTKRDGKDVSGTCSCTATACKTGYHVSGGNCTEDVADSDGVCLKKEYDATREKIDITPATRGAKCSEFCAQKATANKCTDSKKHMTIQSKNMCVCNMNAQDQAAIAGQQQKAEETLLANLKYYEVCGKDKGKSGGKEYCIEGVFENGWTKTGNGYDLNTGVMQGKAFAEEYISYKYKIDVVCHDKYRESGNDDFLKCTSRDNKNFFEIRFDDLTESIDSQREKEQKYAICHVYGMPKTADGVSSPNGCKASNASECDKLKKLASRLAYDIEFGKKDIMIQSGGGGGIAGGVSYTTIPTTACWILARGEKYVATEEKSIEDTFAKIDGLNNKQFYGAHSLNASIPNAVRDYVRGIKGQSARVECNSNTTIIKSIHGNMDNDEVLRCTVNGAPIDFVFDDTTELFWYERKAGESGLGCAALGGTYTGEGCINVGKSECDALATRLRTTCPSCKNPPRWEADKNRCYLPASNTADNINFGAKIGGITLLVVGGVVLTFVSGGTAGAAMAIIIAEAVGGVMEITAEIRLGTAAGKFLEQTTKCGGENCGHCAEAILKNLHTHIAQANDYQTAEVNAIDAEMSRLLTCLPEDSELANKIANGIMNENEGITGEWTPDQIMRAAGIALQLTSLVTGIARVVRVSVSHGTSLPQTVRALNRMERMAKARKARLAAEAKNLRTADKAEDVAVSTVGATRGVARGANGGVDDVVKRYPGLRASETGGNFRYDNIDNLSDAQVNTLLRDMRSNGYYSAQIGSDGKALFFSKEKSAIESAIYNNNLLANRTATAHWLVDDVSATGAIKSADRVSDATSSVKVVDNVPSPKTPDPVAPRPTATPVANQATSFDNDLARMTKQFDNGSQYETAVTRGMNKAQIDEYDAYLKSKGFSTERSMVDGETYIRVFNNKPKTPITSTASAVETAAEREARILSRQASDDVWVNGKLLEGEELAQHRKQVDAMNDALRANDSAPVVRASESASDVSSSVRVANSASQPSSATPILSAKDEALLAAEHQALGTKVSQKIETRAQSGVGRNYERLSEINQNSAVKQYDELSARLGKIDDIDSREYTALERQMAAMRSENPELTTLLRERTGNLDNIDATKSALRQADTDKKIAMTGEMAASFDNAASARNAQKIKNDLLSDFDDLRPRATNWDNLDQGERMNYMNDLVNKVNKQQIGDDAFNGIVFVETGHVDLPGTARGLYNANKDAMMFDMNKMMGLSHDDAVGIVAHEMNHRMQIMGRSSLSPTEVALGYKNYVRPLENQAAYRNNVMELESYEVSNVFKGFTDDAVQVTASKVSDVIVTPKTPVNPVVFSERGHQVIADVTAGKKASVTGMSADEVNNIRNVLKNQGMTDSSIDDAFRYVDDASRSTNVAAKLTKAERLQTAKQTPGGWGWHGTDADISADDVIRWSKGSDSGGAFDGVSIAESRVVSENYAINRLVKNQNPGLTNANFKFDGNTLVIQSDVPLNLNKKTFYMYQLATDGQSSWVKGLRNGYAGSDFAAYYNKGREGTEWLAKEAVNLDDLIRSGRVRIEAPSVR